MAVLAGAGIGALDKGYSGSTSGVGRDFFEVVNTAIAGTANKINIQILNGTPAVTVKQWRDVGSNYEFVNSSTLASGLVVGLNSDIVLNTPLTLLLGDIISLHIPAATPVNNVSVQNATNGTVKWSGGSSNLTATTAKSSIAVNLDGAFNFELTGTAAATESITATDVKIATQRNINTDVINITGAGSYTGTPTSIERLVRYADGANETISDWAEYIATPTGGTFTGSINITLATARPLEILYRFSNSTGVTDATNTFYGGDYVIVCGESLAMDFRTDGSGTLNSNVFDVNLTTGALNTSTTGSGNIALANTLNDTTNRAVFIMNTGTSGLTMLQANEKSAGLYLQDPTTPTVYYNAIVDAYNLAGDVAFLALIIGVNDADVAIASTANYQQSYVDFFASIRSDTRADLTVIANTTGVFTNTTDQTKWSDYTFAQKAAFDSDANVYYTTSYDQPRKDYTHLSPAGYAELGVRIGNGAITEVFGGSAPYQPPQITSAIVISSTETRLNISIPDGTDFTPSSSITEVSLSDDSGATFSVSISSVVQGSSSYITVTHPSAAITNYRYNWGSNPVVTGLVVDNSARNLPLLQSASVVTQSNSGSFGFIIPKPVFSFSGNTAPSGTMGSFGFNVPKPIFSFSGSVTTGFIQNTTNVITVQYPDNI